MRFKDQNWNCGDGPNVQSIEHAQLAVLMDIRDELQQLNRTLSCPNFQQIPGILKRIRAYTSRIRRQL